MKRTIIAIVFLVTAACSTKPVTVPSLYLSTTDAEHATCYANGVSWPARVDGATINCFSGDMPAKIK